MRNTILSILLVGCALPLCARAGSIQVGEIIALSGTTLAARPELAGQVIDSLSQSFTIPSQVAGETVFQGTLISQVVRENVSQTLDFYYRIISEFPQSVDLGTLRLDDFNFAPDVDYFSDSTGDASPGQATRITPNNPGQIVFASFSPAVSLNGSSKTMFIRTSAVVYDKLGEVFADFSNNNLAANQFSLVGPGSVQMQSFRPVEVLIPLPRPVFLVLAGMLGISIRPVLRHFSTRS